VDHDTFIVPGSVAQLIPDSIGDHIFDTLSN
jgi:hypothetical protein